MSKNDKLVAKIRARPSEAKFSDVEAVLRLYGWELARTNGSHNSFVKRTDPDAGTIIVPVHGGTSVKRFYLDRICRVLGIDDE